MGNGGGGVKCEKIRRQGQGTTTPKLRLQEAEVTEKASMGKGKRTHQLLST